MDAQRAIQDALSRALAAVGVSLVSVKVPLEHTTDFVHGDYASGVALQLAKDAKMPARGLAEKIVPEPGTIASVAKTEVAGAGFINFFLSPQTLAEAVEKARAGEKWGANKISGGKKIMGEYTDPNPFKEFHIGHLMSNCIGEAIARLYEFCGAKVRRLCYQGDVG